MPRKAKAKAPHKPRPKRSGAEQPSKPKRARKQAAKPTELAASTAAPRCGQEDCKVCNPPACNNCASCQESRKHPAWDPAKHCPAAKTLRAQPCPNTAPAPRDDDVDPRKLDKKGPCFKAGDDIIEIMDALDDDPTKLEPSNLYALACFKDSLIKSDRLDSRWASLHKIEARDDYNIDDINANQEAAIEAVVREVLFKDGSKPSAEEMARMGPLEMLTVVRVQSYIAPMIYRTRAQIRPKTAAIAQSHSDQARDTFVAIVEGRKYDGVHVATALARKKDEPWPKYWWRSLDLLKEKIYHLTGARKRFYRLLESVRNGAAVWVCRPEMRAWLEERQCQYQRMMVC